MKKNNKHTFILSICICLLPIILGAVLYSRMPDRMPVHFTINDKPDSYAPKWFALFGIPIILAAVQTITCFAASSRKINHGKDPAIIKIMPWIIPVTTVLLYIIMIEIPLGSTVYVGKSICLILGILFIIIGNYLPKMSYKSGKIFFHPAPKSEKAFRKTSRIMGYSFIAMGSILLLLIIWV